MRIADDEIFFLYQQTIYLLCIYLFRIPPYTAIVVISCIIILYSLSLIIIKAPPSGYHGLHGGTVSRWMHLCVDNDSIGIQSNIYHVVDI